MSTFGLTRLAAALVTLAASAAAFAQTTTPAIDGVVAAGTPIVLLGEGFKGTEGPIGLPDGSLLFTETQDNRITRITPDGRISPFADNTNGSNGLALNAAGEIVSVQVLQTRVGIVHPPERRRTLVERADGGLPFGRPNDLVLAKDGTIYFTDSGVNRPANAASAPPAPTPETAKPAVYRLKPQGALERLDDGITRPNGIQLSPDERVLYVANTAGEHVLAYDIAADGRLGPRRNFAKLAGYQQTPTGPSSGADGLAVDAQGRLYVASSAGIEVFDAQGRALGVIALPKAPQNLAFAGPNKRSLYVVGRGAAYRIDTLAQGNLGRSK